MQIFTFFEYGITLKDKMTSGFILWKLKSNFFSVNLFIVNKPGVGFTKLS